MLNQEQSKEPFIQQIITKNIPGVKTGTAAMQAAGIQPEFVTANMQQTRALNCSVILRSGNPPVYNQPRGPKSGLNLSKTSNQGFFKGAIAENIEFARLQSGGIPIEHHTKDKEHLKLSVKDTNYQHTIPLPVNMLDIIRETKTNGDLSILGFNPETGQLRLAYKEGKGSQNFHGQFVLNLHEGKPQQQFFSRPWDKPSHDPQWNAEKNIIKKPTELAAIPDELYERVFSHSFTLTYSETQEADPQVLLPAKVFANTPRTCKEFIDAMGETHPSYKAVIHLSKSTNPSDLHEILALLDEQTIREIYDKSALIVAGDWDGLALGHPNNLEEDYFQVYNTFEPDARKNIEEKYNLLKKANGYLSQLKDQAANKAPDEQSPFDKLILSINNFNKIVSKFALTRAGCITPHEFLFQQLINYAYRDEANRSFGETFNREAIQKTFDSMLAYVQENNPITPNSPAFKERLNNELENNLRAVGARHGTFVIDFLSEHIRDHVQNACNLGSNQYIVPHPQYDHNVHDLYQHGFDMRNPYGCNLEGAWLLISEDGGIIYGETQEQLIEVLLTDDFLEKNRIDVNHGADMAAGWHAVISKQISLHQPIPDKTLVNYEKYITQQSLNECQNNESIPTQNEGQTNESQTTEPMPTPGVFAGFRRIINDLRQSFSTQSKTETSENTHNFEP